MPWALWLETDTARHRVNRNDSPVVGSRTLGHGCSESHPAGSPWFTPSALWALDATQDFRRRTFPLPSNPVPSPLPALAEYNKGAESVTPRPVPLLTLAQRGQQRRPRP